ncbi:hypothetical protein JZ751_002536 [Albula glossodonta]|uniref:Uncharacterized protein n=1 Tax=Albula glossodonta TaxID=121402 RepID=A0A8T2N747_9TELE|nr:hypothetical protein JZ751_002536 [Albula glossodonta]
MKVVLNASSEKRNNTQTGQNGSPSLTPWHAFSPPLPSPLNCALAVSDALQIMSRCKEKDEAGQGATTSRKRACNGSGDCQATHKEYC